MLTALIQSDQYVHVLYEFIYLFGGGGGRRGWWRLGWGMYVCLWGGLLTAMAVELLTSKITAVCKTKRLIITKLFDEQLLPIFDQTLSPTLTTKISFCKV